MKFLNDLGFRSICFGEVFRLLIEPESHACLARVVLLLFQPQPIAILLCPTSRVLEPLLLLFLFFLENVLYSILGG